MSMGWVQWLVGIHSPVKQLFPTPPGEEKGEDVSIVEVDQVLTAATTARSLGTSKRKWPAERGGGILEKRETERERGTVLTCSEDNYLKLATFGPKS